MSDFLLVAYAVSSLTELLLIAIRRHHIKKLRKEAESEKH